MFLRMNVFSKEILNASLLEHDKLWKELAYIYEINHPKLKAIQDERNKIVELIQKIKQDG